MTQLHHAELIVEGQKEPITFKFNPEEITLDKSVQIAEIAIPGLDSPLLQFVRGQNEKLSMDLFFDTTEDGMGANAKSVTTETDKVYSLVKVESKRHAPAICTFLWNKSFPGSSLKATTGSQLRNSFKCIVESVKQRFTLFSPEGVPLRATLSVVFREYKTIEEQLNQLNLSSSDRTHGHIVQQGETLSGIAAQYYSKPGEWRYIAEKNGIDDPRRILPGTALEIPPIE
jgi:nucleoid-associated protein YgaU